MKKISLKVAVLLLAGSTLCSSCIGSFSLFNKYEKWQCSMTNNKFVNGIVGLILQPIVGGICLFVDAWVLNTIEFWTGNQPLAAGTIKNVKGSDGQMYAVKTVKNGYEITAPNGEKTYFKHNKKNDSWSVSQNGVSRDLFKYNEDGTIMAYMQNGETMTVTNDMAGLVAVQEATCNNFYACK
jgi:hypothetical protein